MDPNASLPEERGAPLSIWTLGHSRRPLAAFLELVHSSGIGRIVDVRRHPRSRRQPHFSREQLEPALRAIGVDYVSLTELGGHREPRPDSLHTALRVPAFRGYADHLATVQRLQEAGVTILVTKEKTTDGRGALLAGVKQAYVEFQERHDDPLASDGRDD